MQPIERPTLYVIGFSPTELFCWRTFSHFEIPFYCLARRNAVMLFKKLNLISRAATRVAFKEPHAPDLKYRKAGIPIVMEGTPSILLCVLT
jgi:hypothetical protein